LHGHVERPDVVLRDDLVAATHQIQHDTISSLIPGPIPGLRQARL